MLTMRQVKKEAKKRNIKINGCGPDKWIGEVVPNRTYWLFCISIILACMIHDLAYGIGGTEADRHNADLAFKKNIRYILEHNWWLRFQLWRPSVKARIRLTCYAYYKAVDIKGKSSFNYWRK